MCYVQNDYERTSKNPTANLLAMNRYKLFFIMRGAAKDIIPSMNELTRRHVTPPILLTTIPFTLAKRCPRASILNISPFSVDVQLYSAGWKKNVKYWTHSFPHALCICVLLTWITVSLSRTIFLSEVKSTITRFVLVNRYPSITVSRNSSRVTKYRLGKFWKLLNMKTCESECIIYYACKYSIMNLEIEPTHSVLGFSEPRCEYLGLTGYIYISAT